MNCTQFYRALRNEFSALPQEDFDAVFSYTSGMEPGRAGLCADVLPEIIENAIRENLLRRAAGNPVEYIFGRASFMDWEFEVREGIHIPKNSTETLVEKVLEEIKPGMELLDLGCGSGNIAVSVSLYKGMAVTASDIDPAAAALTEHNAARLGARIRAVVSDLFENISDKFDLIVSNPPYIEEGEALEETVLKQGRTALFSGRDGLDCIGKIAASARAHLKPGGMLFMEIGFGQSGPVREILNSAGWKNINFYRDLSGVNRVVSCS